MMSEALRKAAEQALAALENLDGIDTETECVTICVGDEIDALRAALAESDLNLNCKSTQARLATQWGYVKAEPEQSEHSLE